MGIHTLLELRHYCSSEPLICVPIFANLITKTKFKELTKNIHRNDNANAAPRGEAGHEHLYTLQPVIHGALNSCQKEVNTTSSVMVVDERMVPFKCRSSVK
jgi:hypothetical protein